MNFGKIMTPKEIVWKTIAFDKPERLPYNFPVKFGNDIACKPTRRLYSKMV